MEEIIDNVYYKRFKNTIFIAFCVNQYAIAYSINT